MLLAALPDGYAARVPTIGDSETVTDLIAECRLAVGGALGDRVPAARGVGRHQGDAPPIRPDGLFDGLRFVGFNLSINVTPFDLDDRQRLAENTFR
jgi:hypothetical protein